MCKSPLVVITGIIVLLTLNSCKKYLGEKSNAKFAVIESLNELQLLLNGYGNWNNNSYPYGSELMTDDYYVSTADFNNPGILQMQRDSYIFQDNLQTNAIWDASYRQISQANLILAELGLLEYGKEQEELANNIKGSSLFYRGYFHYAIAQLFCEPYNASTAKQDLGIPIRLTPDDEEKSVRLSVQDTYDRILQDLKDASYLLPIDQLYKTRPAKAAVHGVLAKIYLSMSVYDSAWKYANMCLGYNDSLLNFNIKAEVDTGASAPFRRFNKEVIFHMKSQANTLMSNARAKVDSTLYSSYEVNDLRRVAYFRQNADKTYQFKGDYDGSGTNTGYCYSGIVTDEMYLIRAECYVRKGNISAGLQDLNKLLQSRWRTGTYTSFAAANQQEALEKILMERRKELHRRGARWTDIRRFRNDPLYAITVTRNVNNQTYVLTPSHKRHVFLIPGNVIALSGIQQNP
ncbi:MAG TPA: RagB/SusD family nutrient uptake outer membrane protein [Chitinophagaceae bacterium]